MKVRDIMSKNIIALSPDDPVTKFMSLMETEHIHEVIVSEKNKLKGIVKFKTLVERGITDPSKQKIKNLLESKPPVLNPEQSIEEAAELLSSTGLRALPVLDRGAIAGLVSIWDILEVAAASKEFRQSKADSIMSKVEVLPYHADIGTARVRMRERGISRIPIVDDSGKLAGIIAVHDLLNAVKRPHERMSWYSMAAEMERLVAMPVSNIMNKHAPTGNRRDSLNEIALKMSKNKCSGLTIVENSFPVGMVTVKDLLEVYVSGFQQKGVYYHAIGLTGEDSFVVDTVHRMIGNSLQRISSIYPVQFLFVHFKKYRQSGLKAKWTVRTRIMTDKGLFISNAWAWDSRDAAGEALDRLERILIKEKDESKTRTLKDRRMRKNGGR